MQKLIKPPVLRKQTDLEEKGTTLFLRVVKNLQDDVFISFLMLELVGTNTVVLQAGVKTHRQKQESYRRPELDP